MLLTRLAGSGKAAFWSTSIKTLDDGSALLASETAHTESKSTTLDWVLVGGKQGQVFCTLVLSDEGAQEALSESGLDLEDTEQANATLANMLVSSCERAPFRYEVRDDVAIIHLKEKIEGIPIDVKLEARLVLRGEFVTADLLRVFSIFRREPRKESRKRLAHQGGATTLDATQASEQEAAAASNVLQVVKSKRKKGLKI
jgi:hypothetical protein